MSYADMSNIFWRQRQLLELLQFKLESEQALMAAGKTRWLTHSTREIEMVVEEVRQADLVRAMEVEKLCRELNVTEPPTLSALVAVLPEPWDAIFEEHRQAFLKATGEIVALAEQNRESLARGYQAAQEALNAFGGATERVDTYSRAGQNVSSRASNAARLLDESM